MNDINGKLQEKYETRKQPEQPAYYVPEVIRRNCPALDDPFTSVFEDKPDKLMRYLQYSAIGLLDSTRQATMQLEQAQQTIAEQLRTLEARERVLAIRAKITVPEKEAAELIGISAKALGNKRRNGKIPPECYTQEVKNGKVMYNVEKLIKYFQNK